jgi:serine-type D-Ala-D-Ala carboxypeptidase/endopeptidase (penicillin-binding protein 4)
MFRATAMAILLAAGCASERVSPELRAVMDDPRFTGGRWGLHVIDQVSGEVLYTLGPRERFRTGSTAKVFSVTSALTAFGGSRRFDTPVVHTGTIGGGTLDGDLVLVASGDLTLGGRTKADGTVDIPNYDHTDANVLPGFATLTPEDPRAGLDELAAKVRAAGVTHVKGEVLVDDRLWDPVVLDHVPISPMVVNDNLIDFLLSPGGAPGAPVTFTWRPETTAYTPDVQVTTGAANSAIDLTTTSSASGRLTVSGSIPAGRAPVVWTYQVPEPGAFARTLFIEALIRAGVTVDATPLGPNPVAKLPPSAQVAAATRLAVFTSPPFSEHARLINKVSHNLGANQLPLLLAVKAGKRTLEEGLALERGFIEAAGVDPALFTITDGQGLSGCTVAPEAMTTLLRDLTTRAEFPVFFDSTPILGVDGSLAAVLPPGDPARGHAHAKTGTLVAAAPDGGITLQTKGLAGYIDTSMGRRLAFAIYLNDVPITDVGAVIDVVFRANEALGRMVSIIYQAH